MRIAVVGSGYVGLVSGACFAELGHHVTCIDKNPDRIATLTAGHSPIYEPGLDELLQRNMAEGRLDFSLSLDMAVARAQAVFIAVGTPQSETDGSADLSYLREAAAAIARAVTGFTVVVTKSTVPVGTGDEVEAIMRNVNPAADVAVVSNPEFLREGAAIADFMKPDRVVIGLEDERAVPVMAEIYGPLCAETSIQFTRRRNSELIKYAANAFLALKIAFINEIADLCEAVDGDVKDVAHGMGLDSRIGPRFLVAGPGYGGSCFPKDTLALAATARNAGAPMRLVDATIRANNRRKLAMAKKVAKAFGGDLTGKKIAVLGLTFKANTDDIRESPALTIIPALIAKGAEVSAYDPEGMAHARQLMPDVSYCLEAGEALLEADAAVILTEWDEFKTLNPVAIKHLMKQPLLFDFRNLLTPNLFASAGITVVGLGRATPSLAPETMSHGRIIPFKTRIGHGRSGVPGVASGGPSVEVWPSRHGRGQLANGKP